MKTYNFAFDYNLYSNISVKANNKQEALEIAEEQIWKAIEEMRKLGNSNENMEFSKGELEIVD